MRPTVSVVIPCRNEEQYIHACVQSVLASDYPTESLDVWVCDGLSEDRTPEIVRQLAEEHPNVHLLINEAQVTPKALNLGIRASKGKVVIILGGHAELAADYVSRCVAVLEEKPEVGCVGGLLDNVYANAVSEHIGLAMASPFGVGNAHFRTGTRSGYVDTVAFGAYRRSVLDEIGLFDEELVRNQDDELNYRLLQAGHRIWLDPAIRARYVVRASFAKVYRQYFQYGYWKVFVNKKYGTITTLRQLIPPLFIAYLISLPAVAGLLSLVYPLLAQLYGSGLLAYVLGTFVFAFRSAGVSDRTFPVMSAFVVLHFGYGLGYLEGLIRFLILNKPPRKQRIRLSR